MQQVIFSNVLRAIVGENIDVVIERDRCACSFCCMEDIDYVREIILRRMFGFVIRNLVPRRGTGVHGAVIAEVAHQELNMARVWLVSQSLLGYPHDPVQDAHLPQVALLQAEAPLESYLKVLLHFLFILVERAVDA